MYAYTCVDEWLSGYTCKGIMNAWMRGCVDAWMRVWMGARMHDWVSARISDCKWLSGA